MANNLSAAVFDNSSSVSEASPPTPRKASDTDLIPSTQRTPSAEATASPNTEPSAQTSHDTTRNPQPVLHSQQTAGATRTIDTSGDQPTSGINITTNNPTIPSGVNLNVLTTDRPNFPPGDTTGNVVEPSQI